MNSEIGAYVNDTLSELEEFVVAGVSNSSALRAGLCLPLACLETYITEIGTDMMTNLVLNPGTRDGALKGYRNLGQTLHFRKQKENKAPTFYGLLCDFRRRNQGGSSGRFYEEVSQRYSKIEIRGLIRADFVAPTFNWIGIIDQVLIECRISEDPQSIWKQVSQHYDNSFARFQDCLDLSVRRRNQIMHNLDIRDYGVGFYPISAEDVQSVINLVREMVSVIDKAFLAATERF